MLWTVRAVFRGTFVCGVGGSLSQRWLSAVLSAWLSGNIVCLWDAQRNSPVSPHSGQIRQLDTRSEEEERAT